MYEKLKSFLANDTYFLIILILLIGIGSYGLGRLSVLDVEANNKESAALLPLAPLAQSENINLDTNIVVVASKSGAKYHLPNCPGAKQMNPENKIEFANIAAAEAAGYTPAANCPGL